MPSANSGCLTKSLDFQKCRLLACQGLCDCVLLKPLFSQATSGESTLDEAREEGVHGYLPCSPGHGTSSLFGKIAWVEWESRGSAPHLHTWELAQHSRGRGTVENPQGHLRAITGWWVEGTRVPFPVLPRHHTQETRQLTSHMDV